MPIFDISLPISPAHTPVYPGDPGIKIEDWSALARGDSANVSMLHFSAHTGTHVDAPAHFIEGRPGLAALPLDALIGQARVIEIPGEVRAIDAAQLDQIDFEGLTRVLFKTRNSAFWNHLDGVFREDFTFLTSRAARRLVERGVRLVGIDYLSVDAFTSTDYETHQVLLSNGVIIVEGLDLRAVSAGTYELLCLPLRIASGLGDGAPARAVLRTLD